MEFRYCDVWKFYSCDVCPYRTTSLLRITSHIRQHRTASIPAPFTCDGNVGATFYKCETCGFETPLKVNLGHHVNILHKKLQVKYDYMDILKNFACASCAFQSHSFLLLTRHAWTCATKDELMVLTKSRTRTWKCKFCDFETHDEYLMKKHKRFIHPKDPKTVQKRKEYFATHGNASKMPKIYQIRKCKFCDFETHDEYLMKKHKRLIHPKDPIKTLRKRKENSATHGKASKMPQIYQIPIEKLKYMYVTHRNAFVNKYKNNQHSNIRAVPVPHQNNIYVAQDATSIINEHESNQASEILLVPLHQPSMTPARRGKVSRKRKQHTTIQQMNNTCLPQSDACASTNREQHPKVYQTSVQHLNNTCGTQGEVSANREQHAEVYPTPVQHLNNTGATQSEISVSMDPKQHPDVICPTGVQHLNNTDGAQVEASASTNREQHPEVYSTPITANQINTSNESLQRTTREKNKINYFTPYCNADMSKTYQCKYCSFNTQFKILINYHENVQHKRKVNWDLGRLFQDFECSCCELKTASRLFLMKHTIDRHFVICDCYHKKCTSINHVRCLRKVT